MSHGGQSKEAREFNYTFFSLITYEMVPCIYEAILESKERRRTTLEAHTRSTEPEGPKEDASRDLTSASPTLSTVRDQLDFENGFFILENVGFQVGARYIERLVLDKNPKFVDTLEIMKFICKEFWLKVYHKQIDNLKTNHRGIYLLEDYSFKPCLKMAMPYYCETTDENSAAVKSIPYLAFPCGLLRGALDTFGIHVSVSAEITNLPRCKFHVKSLTSIVEASKK